jgi:hypothetical protein
LWSLSDPDWPAPNLVLLNNALRQTGWRDEPLTETNWREVVRRRLQAIRWDQVVSDVRPFLEPSAEHDLRRFVADMDVALLDATFFSADELPGRDLSQIPHPLATETAERLAGVECDVRLIHLNHSNPLHRVGPERDWLEARGIGVGASGERWRL